MSDILASVSVALGADISAFKAQMATARKELRGLVQAGAMMKDIGQQLSLYVSAPLAVLGLSAVKVGGDFEAAFNRVAAATQASGAELESLKDKAKGIALDPKLKFSATDAAQALENLAKNGLSTAQILGGAADASTNLATATGGNLATAADITTDVMNNFGKAASEAASLVSNITGTTIASKLSIDEYRQALGQAGGVAGQLGVQFSDFNTALAVTSSGFSSGSDAGTSFKTFLQRLVPQSKEAAEAMKKLGLNFFDAQGKMKPLREIAGDLQKAFKGLSDQQRNQLGTEIFGADSIRTALLLAKDGAAGFDKMAESIGKVDAAAQGSILNKGFTGGLEAFKSAFEGLQIAIADSGILKLADVFVRAGAEVLGSLAQLNPGLLQLATIVGGVVAAVGPLSYAIGALLTQLPLLKTGFAALQTAFAGALGPIGLTVLAVAALAAGLIYLNGASDRAVDAFNKQAGSTQALSASVSPLIDRYEQLKAKTTLTAAEQEELRGIVEKIAQQVPSATTAVDAYGKATAISAEKTRDWLVALRQQEKQLAIAALPDQQKKLQQLSKEYAYLTRQIDTFNKTGKIQFFENGKIKEAGAGSKAMQELQLAAANANVTLQEQRALVDKLLASSGRFGEVLPGFEKYGRLAREGADYIRSFGEAADTAAGKVGSLLSEDQIKALAALRKALADNQANYVALGESYDVLGKKQGILQSGIQSLIGVGFKPLGKTVQEFVGQLLKIPTEIDRIDTKLSIFFDKIKKAKEEQEAKDYNPFSTKGTDVDRPLPTNLKRQPIVNKEEVENIQAASEGLVALQQSWEAAAPAIASYAVAIGEAFGNVITGTSSIADALRSVLAGGLDVIADFMRDFGKKLVLIGVGNIALGNIVQGGLQVAGGIALGAAAGIASSFSGRLSGAGAGGGGAYRPVPPTSYAPASTRTTPPAAVAGAADVTITHIVQMTQRGQDLVNTLALQTDRFGRVVGR